MNITKEKKLVKFDSLYCGTLFLYGGEKYCVIHLPGAKTEDGNCKYNAIRLDTGCAYTMEPDTEVQVLAFPEFSPAYFPKKVCVNKLCNGDIFEDEADGKVYLRILDSYYGHNPKRSILTADLASGVTKAFNVDHLVFALEVKSLVVAPK